MMSFKKWKLLFQEISLFLRAEEESDNLYAAIDLVVDKLERQIRRHKTKANKKIREREGISNYFINMDDTPEVYNKHDEIPYKSEKCSFKTNGC